MQLHTYIIYGDRTIIFIDFVGFVTNLLNTPTDGATVSVQKSVSEKALLFVRFCEYIKLPFLLRVPKKYVSILERDKLISFTTH
jgi:hypothetical protein